MIEETGIVVELQGELARVRTERTRSCEGCGSAGFCQMAENGESLIIEAVNHAHANVGQTVRIAVPTASFLKGIFFLYLFPLMGLFGGMAAGYVLGVHHEEGREEAFAVIGAVGGLLLFFIIQRLFNHRFDHDHRYRPSVVNIL